MVNALSPPKIAHRMVQFRRAIDHDDHQRILKSGGTSDGEQNFSMNSSRICKWATGDGGGGWLAGRAEKDFGPHTLAGNFKSLLSALLHRLSIENWRRMSCGMARDGWFFKKIYSNLFWFLIKNFHITQKVLFRTINIKWAMVTDIILPFLLIINE